MRDVPKSLSQIISSVSCAGGFLREQRGYSQEELAERAGLHRNYVGGVERGERNVALENIVKLAGALSVRTRDLFDSLP